MLVGVTQNTRPASTESALADTKITSTDSGTCLQALGLEPGVSDTSSSREDEASLIECIVCYQIRTRRANLWVSGALRTPVRNLGYNL